MLLKTLGFLDLVAAIAVFLLKFDAAHGLAWFAAIYLILKGVATIKCWASVVDVIAGIIIIFTITVGYNFFSALVIAWLIYKAFTSLISF